MIGAISSPHNGVAGGPPEVSAGLRSSEIRYRRLFEAAHDGILLLDPVRRTITDANPFMTTLLGYTHAELLGKELWEIGLLKDEAASQAAFRELQEKGFIRYEDLPLETKTGERREVEFVSNLYQEDASDVIQCNVRDITERKQAEMALAEARMEIGRHAETLEKTVEERTRQLRETIGELEAFAYSVSHDLRAPLRAMLGFTQILREEHSTRLDAEGLGHLEKIAGAARRMDGLIQDVLLDTRVLHAEIKTETVDLDRLVRQVIELYPQLHADRADIVIEGVLPRVLGNEASLAQCVSNLLTNAVKFVAPTTRPRVRIGAETMETDLRLWVEDNGIGIEPRYRERIFKMFERVPHEAGYEDTGIGLAMVRKAVERMGGRIGIEGVPGEGSKFWIQLGKGKIP